MRPIRVFAGLVGFVVVASACPVARATIIYVDDNAPPGGNGSSWPAAFAHLQDALAAAQPGDEIRVGQGIYYPDRDAAHPTGTGDRAVSFTLLDDVVIVGGYAGLGAPAPDERDVTQYVTTLSGDIGTPVSSADNSYHVVHGGSATASAVLDSFTITAGNASGSELNNRGGGVYCESSSPSLTNCTITDNVAAGSYGKGGGLYCSNSSPTLANCAIASNTASGSGGGIYCYGPSTPAITSCAITGNATAGNGGGVFCDSNAAPTLTECTIRGNTTIYSGGGVYCSGSSSPMLTNCTITGNMATFSGGALFCTSSSLMLTNCTITNNVANTGGSGLYCSSSNPTLTNCILWANTPPAIRANSGSPVVSCCDVQGGWTGTGNIDVDPAFAFPDDAHLLSNSPCIDAGTNSPPDGLPPDDLDGQPRPLDGDGDGSPVADMGAYEFNPATPTLALSALELVITARLGQTGSQTLEIRNSSLGALTWDLDCAANWLAAAPPAGESAGEADTVTLTANTVGLAHGTYVTTLWVNADQAVNAPRPVTVVLHVTLALHVPSEYITIQAAIDAAVPGDEVLVADGVYTGAGNKELDFHGLAIIVRSLGNNPAACTIDCEGSGRGFNFHSGEGAASIVQGLTIRNGSAGGVYCYRASPALTNCTIIHNTADGPGGGVHCGTASSPTLTNCTITGNSATGDGGGVYGSNAFQPILASCTITGNTAGGNGGGVHGFYSSPLFTNCTIIGNTADGNGGGVSYEGYSISSLTNCTITGNTAGNGGGLYCDGSSVNPTLTNCILWLNTPQAIYVQSGSPVVTYCDVQGGWSGTQNIDADPGFAFPDDLHLLSTSPCIDAGTNSPPDGLPPDDLDGQARPLDGDGDGSAVADMGTYEFDPVAPTLALSATGLTITARLGQTGSQTLGIRNSSLGTLPWALECDADWLTADPPSGESAGEVDTVTLSVDTANLAHGTYVTTLWVNANQAFNAPRAVAIELQVSSTLHVPSEYPTIQAAIDATILPGDEVAIADGVYAGADNKELDFHGKAITVRSASGDPAACIIDCEGSGRGFYFHSGEGAASAVQGLTIRAGRATLDSPGGAAGGGVYCSGSSPALMNCALADNTAIGGFSTGGGLHCSTSAPTLTNCWITGNFADLGAGIGCDSSSSPTLTNCTIVGNTGFDSYSKGGGLRCDQSAPKLTNCLITGNRAGTGGGVNCDSESSPTLTNCTILGNTTIGSYSRGGAVSCSNSSSPTLTNCIVAGNTAWKGAGLHSDYSSAPLLTNCTITANMTRGGNGGGVYCDASSPKLTNCILWANMPQAIYVQSGGPLITYCDVQDGWSGAGNIDVDPLFTRNSSPGADGQWGTPDDDYGDLRLAHASACIDAGDNLAIPEGVNTDMDDGPRFVDVACRPDTGSGTPPLVDMGAYEASDEPLIDCNGNGLDDLCDVLSGTSGDCNANSVPDECDIATGGSQDCNANFVPDECDIATGASKDCNANGIPDECEPDCNANLVADECDITTGTSLDCNQNLIPDECDIFEGVSADCNADNIPDECQLAYNDCNQNSIPDDCDISSGVSADCQGDGIPDECQLTDNDCNQNSIPDECEGLADCNGNGIWNVCELGTPGHTDCNNNGVLDECDVAWGPSLDCNGNGLPDECDIADGSSADCNVNTVPDECDIADGTSSDVNANGIPDECEAICYGDLDCSGAVDFVDINAFVLYLSNNPAWQTTHAGCNAANGDLDGNGVYPAFADINPFVTLLSTNSLPLPCGSRCHARPRNPGTDRTPRISGEGKGEGMAQSAATLPPAPP